MPKERFRPTWARKVFGDNNLSLKENERVFHAVHVYVVSQTGFLADLESA